MTPCCHLWKIRYCIWKNVTLRKIANTLFFKSNLKLQSFYAFRWCVQYTHYSTVACYSEHSQRCRGWNRAVESVCWVSLQRHLLRSIGQSAKFRADPNGRDGGGSDGRPAKQRALALRIGNARNAGQRASKTPRNVDSTVWMLTQTRRAIGLAMLLFLSTIIESHHDASFYAQ